MDPIRFDQMARLVASFSSRRAVLQGISAGGIASALGLFGTGVVPGIGDEAEAKNRKKRRRKKRKRIKKRKKKCERKCEPNNPLCQKARCNNKGRCKKKPINDTGKECTAANEDDVCCSAVCACDGDKTGNPEADICHQDSFSQTFANNVDGWYDWDNAADTWPDTNNPPTTIVHAGDHAVVKTVVVGPDELTPMTLWGGYSNVFPAGGFDTSLDIFLDVDNAPDSTTFRYSSAISKTDCLFLDEAIFNAGTNADGDFCVSQGGGDPCTGDGAVTIQNSGWYTFRHEFRAAGGGDVITMRLLDGNSQLGAWISTASGALGGNRYGWFPSNAFAGGVQIKNSSRTPA